MNSLKEFYNELSYLEDKKEQLVTLCAFHSLFKVSRFGGPFERRLIAEWQQPLVNDRTEWPTGRRLSIKAHESDE